MEDNWSGELLARWRAGDQQAATELFQRYATRLIALAGSRLPAKLAHRLDPEDVVQSAYRSFFADARAGRFELRRGGDLWRLLAAITLHKLSRQLRRNATEKRSVAREQSFGSEDSLHALKPGQQGHGASPLAAAMFADEVEKVMSGLKPLHRRMFDLRLQGYTIEEIAVQTQRSERRVYRILEELKQQLEQSHLKNSTS